MKRFFTKKSVALIFTAILVVGLLPLHLTHAATTPVPWYVAIGNFFSDGVAGLIRIFFSDVVVPILGFWVGVAGMILDYSIQYTIYGIQLVTNGPFVNGFTIMDAGIKSVWILIRDTANIIFIFVLLYAAIKQIIFGEAAKKMLTSIIISAVLINFSMFFTRIAIDASNLVGTALYNQIDRPGIQTPTGPAKNFLDLVGLTPTIDLSGRIMSGLHMYNLVDDTTKYVEPSAMLFQLIIKTVTYAIIFWVFVMLTVMIIGRFVTLVILLATSPIGFVGGVIPYLGDVSKKWQKNLLDQCLMIPALFFFLLLTLRLAQKLEFQTSGKGSLIINLFQFFLIAYLLFKTVSVVKSFSGEVGKIADKISGAAVGLSIAAASGGAALVARQTVGRGANMLANSQVGKRLEAFGENKGALGWVAKKTSGGIQSTAKKTFDVRETLQSNIGKIGGIAGVGNMVDNAYVGKAGGKFGEGTGYAGMKAEQTKNALKTAKEADKTAKEYEQRITDLHPEIKDIKKEYNDKKDEEIKGLDKQNTDLDTKKVELDKQKADLEKQLKITTTPETQDKIKEQIVEVTKEADGIGAKKAAIETTKQEVIKTKKEATLSDVLISHNEDFSAAEAKIAKFNKMNKDFKTGALELNKMSQKEVEDFENLAKEVKKVEEYKQKNPKIGKVLKFGGEINTLKKLKEVRKKMAENYRNKWKFNTLQRNENEEIAAKLEREAPKEKTEREKELETIGKAQATESAKLAKESESPKREEPPKENK